jgi:cleavage and polyadenylation specificity factor subunit 6/7
LEDLFSPFGKLKNIKFFEEKSNGKSKGYALIEFYSPEAAQAAKESVNGRWDSNYLIFWREHEALTIVYFKMDRMVHGKSVVVTYVSPQSLKQLGRQSGKGKSKMQQKDARGLKQKAPRPGMGRSGQPQQGISQCQRVPIYAINGM